MTVYVTGDVHGRAEYGSSRFAFKNWPLGRTLTRDDAVIVAGDFGFVWDGSNAERYGTADDFLDRHAALPSAARNSAGVRPPSASLRLSVL